MGHNDSTTFPFDHIGYWSEIKLEIIEKYAKAYSTILSNQAGLSHVYIDGFAGAGEHMNKKQEVVAGSPTRAIQVTPPFKEFFLIDLDGDKLDYLRQMHGSRKDVHILRGDCNEVLLKDVFPKVQYKDYRRGLCLLDPYGLDLRWEVIRTAGQMKTLDLFLNFPIEDANRNALWRDPTRVSPAQAARLTAYWGDESWKTDAYRPARQTNLFDPDAREKVNNDTVAEAFRHRLREVAGFKNVPLPLPMRNSKGAVVYYLFFASQKAVANDIVQQIFDKNRERGR